MARKPNYRFERLARERAKAAKKAAKRAARTKAKEDKANMLNPEGIDPETGEVISAESDTGETAAENEENAAEEESVSLGTVEPELRRE